VGRCVLTIISTGAWLALHKINGLQRWKPVLKAISNSTHLSNAGSKLLVGKGMGNRNFVRSVLAEGGSIKPLILPASVSGGLPFCNPSVFVDNGEIWAILRHVNYVLYHCETGELFNNRWGPLSYLNPEHDQHLRTTNYLCKLTPDLDIEHYWKIDTSAFDKEEVWEFVGLEDARLVRWNGHLYGIGVRRDTQPNGQGRMEFSELEVSADAVKEIGRYRIEPPDRTSYCEKNWVPILDQPYRFIKWTNPLELVEVDLVTLEAKQVRPVNESAKIPNLPDLRGGSQVIRWRDSYIYLVHECTMKQNRMGQKNATYRQRFVRWDQDFKNPWIGDAFSFMDGEIEFCCGMALWQDDLLVSFAFQDNASYILRIKATMIPSLIGKNV